MFPFLCPLNFCLICGTIAKIDRMFKFISNHKYFANIKYFISKN